MNARSLIFLFLLVGCAPDAQVVNREGEPEVVHVRTDDSDMNAAMASARRSVDGFVQEIPSLLSSGAYFSVKVPLEVSGGTEHIWLDSPSINGGVFQGALGNVPLDSSYRLGQRVSCEVGEISDWMAVVDGELYGGYTVLVARDQMSKADRRAFDNSVGFKVPEVAREF